MYITTKQLNLMEKLISHGKRGEWENRRGIWAMILTLRRTRTTESVALWAGRRVLRWRILKVSQSLVNAELGLVYHASLLRCGWWHLRTEFFSQAVLYACLFIISESNNSVKIGRNPCATWSQTRCARGSHRHQWNKSAEPVRHELKCWSGGLNLL